MVIKSIETKDIVQLPYPNNSIELVGALKGTAGANAYINFFEKDTTRTCFMLDKPYIYSKIN